MTVVQPATSGRLGNQLFHAAYAFDLASRLGCGVDFDRKPADVEMMLVLNKDGSADEIPTGDLEGRIQVAGIRIQPSPGAGIVRDLIGGVPANDPRVAVHVRRTDFLRPGCGFEALPLSYYERAARLFPGARFAVFSDDLPWCRSWISPPGVDFVDLADPAEALRAMAACEHHIIANSSFSWWAAWLADTRPDHVTVAPSVWFKGASSARHIPEHWRVV
jgi:hypothetical protein